MTDRERINKAYGILTGAARNAQWMGDNPRDRSEARYLIRVTIIDTILDILNVDSTAQLFKIIYTNHGFLFSQYESSLGDFNTL